ncbi:SCO7613 C-terminal domain-containing membrane protein [Gulosibacter sp. 10]|uniref:SCO7613 C-terminal domain-containing membrane protein n=1 Tax=Gulosibacter sp. 10 TaxID=1255570 RepID=UPI00097F2A70|nr:hypothetical protein [Gulosibacter sp. 10]SJM50971.1 putative integral membrane protein [Gulosibacter sp. 10]
MTEGDRRSEEHRTARFPESVEDLRTTSLCPMCLEPTAGSPTCRECGLDLTRGELAEVFSLSTTAADALTRRGLLLQDAWRASQRTVREPEAASETPAAPARQRDETPPRVEATGSVDAELPPLPPLSADAALAAPGAGWGTTPNAAPSSPPLRPSAQDAPPPASAPPQQSAPSMIGTPSTPGAPSAPSGPPAPPAPQPDAEPTRPRRSSIQVMLLVTGVAFVSVAAAVFLTVAFVLFDLTVKAIITAGVTASVLAGASLLRRRGLAVTAEGFAVLGVVLLLLDAWAIRALDFFGAEGAPVSGYWGAALILLSAVLLGWGRLSRLRAPTIAAAFSGVPGVLLLGVWLLGLVVGEVSALLPAACGAIAASLLAVRLHRREGGPDPLETGIVLGLGQLASLPLILAPGQQPPYGAAHWAIATIAALLGSLALLGHAEWFRRGGAQRIRPLRISAAVLATLSWAGGIGSAWWLLERTAALDRLPAAFLLAPLLALPALLWDLRFLRTGARDRPLRLAGLITAGLVALPAAGLVLFVFGFNALAGGLDAQAHRPAFLALGASALPLLALSALLYRSLAPAVFPRRTLGLGIGALIAVTALVLGLPELASRIGLALLVVLFTAAAVVLGRGRDSLRAALLVGTIVAAAVLWLSCVDAADLATPAAGLGFLALLAFRMLRGELPGVVATAAAGAFGGIALAHALSEAAHPVVAVLGAIAPAVLLLAVALLRRVRIRPAERIAFAALALGYAVIAAALRTTRPVGAPFELGADAIALALSVAGTVVLVLGVRSADPDAPAHETATHRIALVTALPLAMLALHPVLRLFGDSSEWRLGAPLGAWLHVGAALLAAGLLAGLRLRRGAGARTLPADVLAVLLAALELPRIAMLPSSPVDWVSFAPTAVACAVPLLAAVERRPRTGLRAILPWIAPLLFAATGPVIVTRAVADPWPVLVAAPLAVALLAAAAVFIRSGLPARIDHGGWYAAGLLLGGGFIPYVALLATRPTVADWWFSALAAVLGFLVLTALGGLRTGPLRTPVRVLFVTALAPAAVLAAVIAIDAALYAAAESGGLGVTTASSAIAGGTGLAIALSAVLAFRGLHDGRPADDGLVPAELSRAALAVACGGILLVLLMAAALPSRAIDLALLLATAGLAATAPRWPGRTPSAPSPARLGIPFFALAVFLAAGVAGLAGDPVAAAPVAAGAVFAALLGGGALAMIAVRPTSPRDRGLLFAGITLALWAALMSAPVPWLYWPVTASSTLAVGAALLVAVLRARLTRIGALPAAVAAPLPFVAALFADDASSRPFAIAGLAIGLALVAVAFAVSRTGSRRFAAAARGAGATLALAWSANLFWPDHVDERILAIALPGTVLLALLAWFVALDERRDGSPTTRFEVSAYAACAPVWPAVIALIGGTGLHADAFGILALALAAVATVLAVTSAFLCPPGTLARSAVDAATIGSGAAALLAALAALLFGSSLPADAFFLAFGLAATVIGLLQLRARPALRSLPALGPGLGLLLLPLWLIELGDPTAARIGVYTLLAVGALLLGALGKLQAPLVLGSAAVVAHIIVALNWMVPNLSVPWWLWLGSAGALLIFVAATYEARLRNAKSLVRSFRALR